MFQSWRMPGARERYRGVRDVSGPSLRDPAPALVLGLRELRRAGRHLRDQLGLHGAGARDEPRRALRFLANWTPW
jgi:hypothetical protein